MGNLSVNHSEPIGGNHAELSKRSPLVVRARLVFKAMLWIFAVCILIQVFLAGLALFWDSAEWASHRGFARLLIIIPVLTFVVSFIARLPLSLRLRSAGLIGIVVLIAVSAMLPSEIGYVSALHPVLAIMLIKETIAIARKTDASPRQ